MSKYVNDCKYCKENWYGKCQFKLCDSFTKRNYNFIYDIFFKFYTKFIKNE